MHLILASNRVECCPERFQMQAATHSVYIGAGCEAVFNLNCPNGRVELRESFGFSTRELNQVAEQLKTEQGILCPAWRTIHHDY